MNQLAEQLRAADRVCTQAYPFFERAAAIRVEAETKAAKRRRNGNIIAVLDGMFGGEFLGVLAGMVVMALTPIAALGAAVFIGIYLYKGIFAPRIQATYEASMQEADALEAEGTKILEDNAQIVSVIPSDYWYPTATGYLVKIVETGRTNDINQALQMCDEQLHRWSVENANAEILSQQQTQTQALKGIRRSNAINAAANVANAAVNISRWF